MTLTPKQRQYLRGLAHPFEPVVRIGKGGVSPSVIAETKKALNSHELIKIRVEGEERKSLVEKLAAETASDIAGIVGKTAILYRAREEDPEIELP